MLQGPLATRQTRLRRHGRDWGWRRSQKKDAPKAAPDHLDAGLRADHRWHGLVDYAPGIVGLDLEDLGGPVALPGVDQDSRATFRGGIWAQRADLPDV